MYEAPIRKQVEILPQLATVGSKEKKSMLWVVSSIFYQKILSRDGLIFSSSQCITGIAQPLPRF